MTTINPCGGMTRNGFLILLEQNGISLDESRMAEVNYYFNLWCDTMKQDRKAWSRAPGSQIHNFPAFITWMKKQ